MRFDAANLASRFARYEEVAGRPARYVIAFSGGLDSTVLMHSLEGLQANDERFSAVPVLAIYIDHGLQSESELWAVQCGKVAASCGFEFRGLKANVQLESGKGMEASARDARYTALRGELESGDWLLSAHHREDQAETLMLNLIRGTGPAGLAGIGGLQRFGPGWLVRPMLDVDRDDIRHYAEEEGLQWQEDPSNTDRRFDRNFLRHEILPRLKARWPDIAARLHRSAANAGEAHELLIDLAEIDIARLDCTTKRLPIDGLVRLSDARQRNVIRFALRDQGLTTPTALQLEHIMKEVIPARADAQPLVRWPGGSVRRYRNGLYLLPEIIAGAVSSGPVSGSVHEIGTGLGKLEFVPDSDVGLSDSLVRDGLIVKSRVGGEEIKLENQSITKKLKKLLQEESVVPWMRDRLPLLYSGDRLVAVGDLWLAHDAISRPGIGVHWADRPALH